MGAEMEVYVRAQQHRLPYTKADLATSGTTPQVDYAASWTTSSVERTMFSSYWSRYLLKYVGQENALCEWYHFQAKSQITEGATCLLCFLFLAVNTQ